MAGDPADQKPAAAFRTIGDVSRETGLPQHILRYWETRFPQLRPLTRAGNRRYYRPDDVALVRRIDQALNRDGYTIRGVQQLLSAGGKPDAPVTPAAPPPDAPPAAKTAAAPAIDVTAQLRVLRDHLAQALATDLN